MKRRLGAGELGKRVAREARELGLAPERIRRWVAAAAFLELFNVARNERRIDEYCIKGGFAVELRQPKRARASQDIDIIVSGSATDRELVETVIARSWTQFTFSIKDEGQRDHATRLTLQAIFNNVPWATIKVDIVREPIGAVEALPSHDLTRYGLPEAEPIPCLSRAEQMAQYIHAITLPANAKRRQNRARNLIDVYVFDEFVGCSIDDIRIASIALFERRGTHRFPPTVDIPLAWYDEIESLASDLGIDLDARGIVQHFTALIACILGVRTIMNYEYQFVVLTADEQAASNALHTVFKGGIALESFTRFTQEEGYRVATMLSFPGVPAGRGVIAVLERERAQAEKI